MKTHKLFLFLLFFSFSVFVSATNYYVDATLGSDSNNGLSTNTAWKTLSKVSSSNFVANDSILFKRGETFRGNITAVRNGSASGSVVYGAYGIGNKPILMGSVQKNLTSDWISIGTNLWETSSALIADVGNIIFNNEASCGVKVSAANLLNAQGKYFSTSTFKVQMYSVSNPATFYTNIELAVTKKVIHMWQNSYITFENLDLKYGGAQGIQGQYNYNIWIKDCDFAYFGGGYQSGTTTRYGNPVTFYGSNHDCIVERCTFRQAYDVAMSSQGDQTDNLVYNIYFRNNLVDKCEQSYEFWCRGTNAQAHDIYFENNTCKNAGYGWSRSQRPAPNGVHLLFWGSPTTTVMSNIYIRNNIFTNAMDAGIFEASTTYANTNSSKIIINNNCWNVTNQIAIMTGWDSSKPGPITTIYDLATYQANTSNDLNSIFANPQLSANDTLSTNSPCINAGLTLTTVTSDFRKALRPQGGGYDIGAYELIDTQAPTAPTSLAASLVTTSSFTLSWVAATDNLGVVGYDIYEGANLIGSTTTALSFSLSGLNQGTTYSMTVVAKDNAGNSTSSSPLLVTTTSSNLLSNPGFESGITSWVGINSTIVSSTVRYAGTKGCYVTLRSTSASGPNQIITSSVANLGSGNYYLEAWVKMKSGTSNIKLTLHYKYNNTNYYVSTTNVSVGTSWTKVSGTVNVDYTGTLEVCDFYIQTAAGTTNYYADDCVVSFVNRMNMKGFTTDMDVVSSNDISVSLFPNPASNNLSIKVSSLTNNEKLQIYNLTGRMVKEIELQNLIQQVDISDLPKGIYLVRLNNSPNLTSKFTKQ